MSKGKLEFAPFSTFATHHSRKFLHHLSGFVELFYHTVHICDIHTCTLGNSVLSGWIQQIRVSSLFQSHGVDSRSPRDGRFIEEIGTYDPNLEPSAIKVDEEAAKKWLNNGAQPTEVVGKIFKAAGIEK